MNRPTPMLISLAGLLTAASLVLAGDLNPPAGPVSATGRFGPRTEINAANTPGDANSIFKITAPGSYYLTGNITGVIGKHGIEIASPGVTLDLMGFELLGRVGSFDGINVSLTVVNLHIHNGSIRGWSGDAVDAVLASNSSLRDLLADGNAGSGLHIRDGLVEACAARFNGGRGIVAGTASTVSGNTASFNTSDGISTAIGCTVTGNTVQSNGGRGIFTSFANTVSGNTVKINTGDGISTGRGSTVTGNTVQSNGGTGILTNAGCTISGNSASFNTSDGISALQSCTVSGNTAESNTGDGISAGSSCTVSGNTAEHNTGDGIQVFSDCSILNNACDRNGFSIGNGAGIHALSRKNRIEGNNVTNNDRGIDVDVAGNLIIRNSASGNTVNYAIVSGNVGFYVVGTTTGAVNGSSGGTTVGTTNPWVNFSY